MRIEYKSQYKLHDFANWWTNCILISSFKFVFMAYRVIICMHCNIYIYICMVVMNIHNVLYNMVEAHWIYFDLSITQMCLHHIPVQRLCFSSSSTTTVLWTSQSLEALVRAETFSSLQRQMCLLLRDATCSSCYVKLLDSGNFLPFHLVC